MVVVWDWREGKMKSYYSVDVKFQFSKMKKFWRFVAQQCEYI
jgi:hypothetical protein